MTRVSLLVGALLASLGANAGWGHEFSVDVVFEAGVPAGARQQFTEQFVRAAAERDAHAGQESDGHLGGVDVYLRDVTDDAAPSTADILVMAGFADGCVEAAARGAAGLAVDAGRTVAELGETARAEHARRYGEAVDDVAGYAVAMALEVSVRAQDGVADRSALAAATAGACR